MKILYAIQGTGNGHISRAKEIIPHLKKKGSVDILVSGTNYDLKLPFKIDYQLKGLSFVFGKKGGIDIWNTYLKLNSILLLKDIKKLPVNKYDLVISDFEPISAWACLRNKKKSIGLSNQISLLNPDIPKPNHHDFLGQFIIEKYAPTIVNYGLHYKSLEKNTFTPIIRSEVRELEIMEKEHYTVYLPSYRLEKIENHLKNFKDVSWEVFTKQVQKDRKIKNIVYKPLNSKEFLKSMASSKGVLCNAGFGTTSEALFLNKKLLVIPMKSQYEQLCNTFTLQSMGIDSIKNLKPKYIEMTEKWLNENTKININYPDYTKEIVEQIIDENYTKI